jgi:hypothetical protein
MKNEKSWGAIHSALLCLAMSLLFFACSDGKTYIEMLEDEQNAIARYIADNGFEILNTFPQDAVFQPNQFYRTEDGLYINIVKKGIPVTYTNGEIIYMRYPTLHFFHGTYSEDILQTKDEEAYITAYIYGIPTVYQDSGSPDNIICDGTVYPLQYVGYEGRVKLIVPSKLGNSACKSSVWPMYIELIYTTAHIPE